MNSATIKRGSASGARGGRAGRKPRRARSNLDKLLDYVPLSPAQINRLMTWGIGLVLFILLWVTASFMGLPAMLRAEVNDLAGRAGFAVAKIEVRGLERMDEMQVSDIAVKYVERSMLAVDLDNLRNEVMRLGWVKEARISRRLPDALIVDVVERQPAAVWQNGGQLMLVDAAGVALGPVEANALPDLPLVVGPDANKRTKALAELMNAAPALKPMLAGATWVGGRRWDLRFQSGEQLMLPEGDADAAAALVNFARMDGVDRLLGRGVLRFDMRDPARFVLRLPPGKKEDEAPAVTSAKDSAVVTSGEKDRSTTSASGGEG
ncbi:cell division protein FtsQ [Sphingobium sp. B1D7B]|uniref:cell division protein FtsQ/DivIB n=1 Tax=unclassified Sphingobium TaxID=2611147 RepID=UPI0022258F0D|nr:MULTISPECIES: cell division protein FtsQ/DivIB [unclassified Sphingobium]MCW2351225.1 cell division protein FtsQ [Sphingobium sp. B12D2B]MCW2388888.1 cell division protein FtsQ [Sphingobium sp. B11D3B]MCW2393143.1 cell division protein FtsQ [Sphingobium sp. B11D3A]MCW2395423.1 cell division protein FtsQ [Sphingobium sp. B8D3B]MCW2404948.1 cell division protein FtsQ [Sphingobium sp. B1D7B]